MTDTPAPRYVVVRGGTPTCEQLAALVVALTPVVEAVPAEASGGPDAAAPEPWRRAALLEGVGGSVAVSAADAVAAAW